MIRTLALALAAGAVWGAAAPEAAAAPDYSLGPNCDTVLWGFLGGQRRTLCDGPLRGDGTWERKRSIWVPAHTTPIRTSCSGGRYSSYCTTYGGDFVPFTIVDQQTYVVTPDTVLPDEPGHLG